MKRLLIIFLTLIMAFNIAGARKSKKRAGEITDGIYTDLKYDFTMAAPDGWKSSIKKPDSDVRLVLSKKVYEIPIDYQSQPTYTKVPKITVFIDTTSMPVEWFVDSILSDKYKSDQKKKIMEECEILSISERYVEEFRKMKHSKMTIGDINGIILTGERRYRINIPDPVTNFYGGVMFFAKKGGNIFIFHFICEKIYFEELYKDFTDIVNTLQFIEPEADKNKDKDKG